MADERPFPPGEYPIVVVGSGPGALQTSYFLGRYGIDHAVISADPGPGGMFRKWPFFQRLLSWTKPYAPAERTSRAFERWDWNSLLAIEPELRGISAEFWRSTIGSLTLGRNTRSGLRLCSLSGMAWLCSAALSAPA